MEARGGGGGLFATVLLIAWYYFYDNLIHLRSGVHIFCDFQFQNVKMHFFHLKVMKEIKVIL